MNYKFKDGTILSVSKEAEGHLLAHPDVWGMLEEALGSIVPKDDFLLKEVKFDRVVGLSGAVHRTERDGICHLLPFAKRVERENWSRVEVTVPAECSSVVVIAKKTESGEYELLTAYIGWLSEREPTDPGLLTMGELAISLEFWRSYALVYDAEIFGKIEYKTWGDVLLN